MQALRDRQAKLARAGILDALIARLEREDADELSMEVLAADAGVSRRTLYRYFPTRELLYAAAGERIERLFELPTDVTGGAEGISASFAHASRQLQRRPALARAMVRSRVGTAVRSPLRETRRAAIEEALAETTVDLPVHESRRAAAVIAHLCSSATWIALQDEAHLSPEESRQAITWALDTLIGDLRRRQDHDQRNAS
jgi:AcrR family transcriptional regulator